MEKKQLKDTLLTDYIPTSDNDCDFFVISSATFTDDQHETIATISVDGTEYSISAQAGNYLSNNALTTMSYSEYASLSSELTSNNIYYFTYE